MGILNLSFNPCSYGFTRKTLQLILVHACDLCVSILVLMDLPGRPYPGYDHRAVSRFNPCSYGFTRKTRAFLPLPDCNWPVSILVLMDLPGRLLYSLQNDKHNQVSILVLMDLPGRHLDPDAANNPITCFNPCSYGFTRKTGKNCIVEVHPWGFQSLFLWIYPEDVPARFQRPGESGVSILVLMDLPGRLQRGQSP